jgi:hypothetical protein
MTFTDASPAVPPVASRRYQSAVPGHSNAVELDSVDAGTLTEERFRREYVDEWRPVRIAGAIKHWPAIRLWKSAEYLMGRVGAERDVRARNHPAILYPATEAHTRQNADTAEDMTFAEFVRRACAPKAGHLMLQSYVIGDDYRSGSPFTPAELRAHRFAAKPEHRFLPWLGADMDGFYFLPNPRPSRLYPPYRTFVFRNSYTDWHWHPTDETLMCQVVGAKQVLMLPPDEESWNVLVPILKEHGRTFDHDFSEAFSRANLAGLRRAVVAPGDAVYIPPYWWHSVESLEQSMGMTVAACWRTDLTARGSGDLRYPAARLVLRRLLGGSNAMSALPNAAMAAAAIGSSYARRLLGTVSRRPRRG